jgi:hypothetical protein
MTDQEDVLVPLADGDRDSDQQGGESWLAEQIRLVALEDGFA